MPIFKAVLVFRRGVGPAASFRLSLQDVIILLSGGPSSPRCVFWLEIVDAFVTRLFFTDWAVNPARTSYPRGRWKFIFRVSILLDQLLTTADEFDPLGFVVRGVLPVVAAHPGRPALQQGQRLLRRLLFARHVRHKTFEVFYKNIRTTLLFHLVLGNMPPVGSRGLVPRASISRDLPLSTTWGRAGSGLVAPCEVGKWLLPHLPALSFYSSTILPVCLFPNLQSPIPCYESISLLIHRLFTREF